MILVEQAGRNGYTSLMVRDTWVLRDELVEALRGLEAQTEEIYLSLGKDYPKLLSETRANVASAEATVDEVRGGGSDGFTGLVDSVRAYLMATARRFEDLHAKDRQLITRLREGIDRLAGLDELISCIREDSIEMELISLNAMTVALKAGNAGKAFSYITEELQRLSTRTISLTEDITSRGASLLERFRGFQHQVAELSGFQERLFGERLTELLSRFDRVSEGIVETTGLLDRVARRASEIRQPLHRIVEEIQLQDIIRQSVDHVILSLDEINEQRSDLSDRERLDELSFFASLPPLCRALLEDVADRIRHSTQLFEAQVVAAQNVLADVENERRSFVAYLADVDKSVDARYRRAAGGMEELTTDLEKSLAMKRSVSESSRTLTEDVHDLADRFASFASLLTRYHSIDIASRIEVAKQKVLQQMSGTVEEMTELTKRIENDVDRSLKSTKEFISTIGKTIGEIEEFQRAEHRLFDEFDGRIRQEYGRLSRAKESLVAGVSGFSVFSRDFFTLFKTTKTKVEALSGLLPTISLIQDRLQGIEEVAQGLMKPIQSRLGVESWSISNGRLQEIIKRFTIFTHKQTAGEIGGFAVEDGVESGEVTLF